MPKRRPIRTVQVQDANSDTLIELDISLDDEAFVTAYFDNNMNATRAYMELHPNAQYNTARAQGSEIVAKPNIRARIGEIIREKAMPRDEVLMRLGDMARATQQPFIRITDDGFIYFDFSHPEAKANLHLIKKIKTKRERRVEGTGENAENWEGEWVEVELYDSQKALELIGKYYKLFDDKREDDKSGERQPLSIPADLLTSDFVNVYRDIMAGKHSEYPFDGGRGGLKSTFISEIIPVLMGNNPQMHALVLRMVKDTLRESVYSQLMWAIDTLGLSSKFEYKVSPMEITYIPTGQKIYFRGADKPETIKSIKPPFGYIGIVWFEEYDQFKGQASIRNIVQSALRGGDTAFQFKSWNTPRTINHWVHREMQTPKENRYPLVHSNYRNVPPEWLGKIFLDEAEHLKAVNPDAYDHEYGGIANGVGGMVFENLEESTITDEEIATFNGYNDGIDWGYYPDPFVWGRSYYDPARLTLYIYDEYYVHKKSNRDTYDYLVKNKGISASDLIIADNAEPKSIADYRSYGANVRGAEKGPDSVTYSMKWLQSLVKIVIDPVRCPHHAQEFREYEHERTKDGEIISGYPDKNNHCIDRTRYAHNLIWRRSGQ